MEGLHLFISPIDNDLQNYPVTRIRYLFYPLLASVTKLKCLNHIVLGKENKNGEKLVHSSPLSPIQAKSWKKFWLVFKFFRCSKL